MASPPTLQDILRLVRFAAGGAQVGPLPPVPPTGQPSPPSPAPFTFQDWQTPEIPDRPPYVPPVPKTVAGFGGNLRQDLELVTRGLWDLAARPDEAGRLLLDLTAGGLNTAGANHPALAPQSELAGQVGEAIQGQYGDLGEYLYQAPVQAALDAIDAVDLVPGGIATAATMPLRARRIAEVTAKRAAQKFGRQPWAIKGLQGIYSQGVKASLTGLPEKGVNITQPQAVVNALKKLGVKPEEIAYTKFLDGLDALRAQLPAEAKGVATREQVAEIFQRGLPTFTQKHQVKYGTVTPAMERVIAQAGLTAPDPADRVAWREFADQLRAWRDKEWQAAIDRGEYDYDKTRRLEQVIEQINDLPTAMLEGTGARFKTYSPKGLPQYQESLTQLPNQPRDVSQWRAFRPGDVDEEPNVWVVVDHNGIEVGRATAPTPDAAIQQLLEDTGMQTVTIPIPEAGQYGHWSQPNLFHERWALGRAASPADERVRPPRPRLEDIPEPSASDPLFLDWYRRYTGYDEIPSEDYVGSYLDTYRSEQLRQARARYDQEGLAWMRENPDRMVSIERQMDPYNKGRQSGWLDQQRQVPTGEQQPVVILPSGERIPFGPEDPTDLPEAVEALRQRYPDAQIETQPWTAAEAYQRRQDVDVELAGLQARYIDPNAPPSLQQLQREYARWRGSQLDDQLEDPVRTAGALPESGRTLIPGRPLGWSEHPGQQHPPLDENTIKGLMMKQGLMRAIFQDKGYFWPAGSVESGFYGSHVAKTLPSVRFDPMGHVKPWYAYGTPEEAEQGASWLRAQGRQVEVRRTPQGTYQVVDLPTGTLSGVSEPLDEADLAQKVPAPIAARLSDPLQSTVEMPSRRVVKVVTPEDYGLDAHAAYRRSQGYTEEEIAEARADALRQHAESEAQNLQYDATDNEPGVTYRAQADPSDPNRYEILREQAPRAYTREVEARIGQGMEESVAQQEALGAFDLQGYRALRQQLQEAGMSPADAKAILSTPDPNLFDPMLTEDRLVAEAMLNAKPGGDKAAQRVEAVRKAQKTLARYATLREQLAAAGLRSAGDVEAAQARFAPVTHLPRTLETSPLTGGGLVRREAGVVTYEPGPWAHGEAEGIPVGSMKLREQYDVEEVRRAEKLIKQFFSDEKGRPLLQVEQGFVHVLPKQGEGGLAPGWDLPLQKLPPEVRARLVKEGLPLFTLLPILAAMEASGGGER